MILYCLHPNNAGKAATAIEGYGRTGCALHGRITTIIHFSNCASLYAFTVSKESRIVPDAKDWTDRWGKRLAIVSGEARKTYFNL